MTKEQIIILILSIILGLILSYPIFGYPFIANYIYKKHLVRTSKDKWSRRCSDPTHYDQVIMFNEGISWADENKKFIKEIKINSDGYNLFGEYFDFGFDKAVIIVAGRTESLLYSYYYAKPYKEAGYNVFVFDKRAHGLSDGKYEDCGHHSYIDVINFAKELHTKFNAKEIILHGICIGASVCLFAITNKNCPNYITKLITDGMYSTFRNSFKRHMKVDSRQTFLILDEIMLLALIHSKANFTFNGPYYQIKKMKKPILMIYTSNDLYSTVKDGEKMLSRCPSDNKKLVVYEKGLHSHVRSHNKEEYDKEIKEFIK